MRIKRAYIFSAMLLLPALVFANPVVSNPGNMGAAIAIVVVALLVDDRLRS